MEAELRANLLELATRYAEATGRKMATVCQEALGDWRFFRRLEEKDTTSFTIRKYDAAVAWFSARWPEAAEWPVSVLRPSANAQDAA